MNEVVTDLPPAFILVGGQGQRLRAVFADRPKPMAPVAGKPFLEWLVLSLRSQGIRRFVFCTGYLADSVESHFGNGSDWSVSISYACEHAPLGTGGAARNAIDTVETQRILVCNGDSYCRCDVPRLCHEHRTDRASATMWVLRQDNCQRYGRVDIRSDGTVIGFHEKSQAAGAGFINAGIYLMDREVIESIPDGRPVSMENEVLPGLVGRELHAVVGDGPFVDIGTPETYQAAHQLIANESLV